MTTLLTGTVTFLFTDIEGSTVLLQRLGDRRYVEILAEHQQPLRDAFAKGQGQEVDTQGDAFLVALTITSSMAHVEGLNPPACQYELKSKAPPVAYPGTDTI